MHMVTASPRGAPPRGELRHQPLPEARLLLCAEQGQVGRRADAAVAAAAAAVVSSRLGLATAAARGLRLGLAQAGASLAQPTTSRCCRLLAPAAPARRAPRQQRPPEGRIRHVGRGDVVAQQQQLPLRLAVELDLEVASRRLRLVVPPLLLRPSCSPCAAARSSSYSAWKARSISRRFATW